MPGVFLDDHPEFIGGIINGVDLFRRRNAFLHQGSGV